MERETDNKIAKCCSVFAMLILIFGFCIGIVASFGGEKIFNFMTLIWYWSGFFAAGLFFFGIGEIIKYLDLIYEKLDD